MADCDYECVRAYLKKKILYKINNYYLTNQNARELIRKKTKRKKKMQHTFNNKFL